MPPPLDQGPQQAREICPVCAGTDLQSILRRDGVPIYVNKIYATAAAARAAARDTLEMMHCGVCDVLFNRYFDFEKLDYSADYESGAPQSPAYRKHLQDMARRIGGTIHTNATVAEIGCGKGDFLCILLELLPGARAFGIDESYDGPLETMDGRLHFERRQFGGAAERIDADAVVLRLMLEHVADPRSFLRSVSNSLPAERRRILLERARSEWIIERAAFLDFYYERYTLFSETTIAWLADDCDLVLVEDSEVFGGQYAFNSLAAFGTPKRAVASVAAQVAAFGERATAYAARWSDAVSAAAGTCVLWGAGARGTTFLQIADPDAARIPCVIDLSPRKQGSYVAGTGHAVVSPSAAAAFEPKIIFVTNPAFVKEVQASCGREFPGATVVLVGDLPETSRCSRERPMPF